MCNNADSEVVTRELIRSLWPVMANFQFITAYCKMWDSGFVYSLARNSRSIYCNYNAL